MNVQISGWSRVSRWGSGVLHCLRGGSRVQPPCWIRHWMTTKFFLPLIATLFSYPKLHFFLLPLKGRTQCRELPLCAGSGEGCQWQALPSPVQYEETATRTRDLPVTGGKTLPLAPGPPLAVLRSRWVSTGWPPNSPPDHPLFPVADLWFFSWGMPH